MVISLIVALSQNYVIGQGNALPWHLSEDLKRFKQLTMGHPMIMGRKTFDSIGRVLPGRESWVISRQSGLRIPGAQVFGSLDECWTRARERGLAEVFVIGGAEIYRQTLPVADRLYLTWIYQSIAGDAFFPQWDPADFRETHREDHRNRETLPFAWVTLERIQRKA